MPTDTNLTASDRVEIEDVLEAGSEDPGRTIIENLSSSPKSIPSKFFYDSRGSELFEKITGLSEYYIPEVEKRLLRETGPLLRPELEGADVVEIGSGGPEKMITLLTAAFDGQPRGCRYVPVDISSAAIEESAGRFRELFDQVGFYGLVADFFSQLDAVPEVRRRFFCFLGSTLGNMSRRQQHSFLDELCGVMKPGDNLLLGVDRPKEREVLERAYDDSRGVTARFNRNILNVANRHAETDFTPEDFEHLAFYNEKQKRIEMHLKPRNRSGSQHPAFSRT